MWAGDPVHLGAALVRIDVGIGSIDKEPLAGWKMTLGTVAWTYYADMEMHMLVQTEATTKLQRRLTCTQVMSELKRWMKVTHS